MPDLHGWLTQQIDRTEHQARAAAEFQALEWSCPSTGVVDFGDDLLATGDRDVAYHIVAHDPATVLRRCAADRKILAEHKPYADYWIDYYACEGCGMDGADPADWMTGHVNDCPTLLALAEGYGLAEEQRAALDRPEKERPEPAEPKTELDRLMNVYSKAITEMVMNGRPVESRLYVKKIPGTPIPDWLREDLGLPAPPSEPTPGERAFAVVEPHLSALALYKPKEQP